MNPSDAAKHAARTAFEATCLVANYLGQSVQPVLASLRLSDPTTNYLVGIMHRAVFNSQSLAALPHFVHFQATAAIYRAILELMVDAILVKYEEPEDVLERIAAWEESAKLHYAEAIMRYLNAKREPVAAEWQPLTDFIAANGERIRKSRPEFWPTKSGRQRHPGRWTGRNLGADVGTADDLHGSNLRDLYEKDYRRLNWQIHGSSLVGVKGLDVSGFCAAYWLSQKNGSCILLELTDLFLEHVGTDRFELVNVKYQWVLKLEESSTLLDAAAKQPDV